MKCSDTPDTPEKHLAVFILKISVEIELRSLQSIRFIEISELLRNRVEFRDAVIGADPQITGIIGKNAVDEIIDQSIGNAVMLECAAGWFI